MGVFQYFYRCEILVYDDLIQLFDPETGVPHLCSFLRLSQHDRFVARTKTLLSVLYRVETTLKEMSRVFNIN